jgi:hypothetical protein
MEAVLISKAVALIVVDSLAAVARTDFGADRIVERQQLLGVPLSPCVLSLTKGRHVAARPSAFTAQLGLMSNVG